MPSSALATAESAFAEPQWGTPAEHGQCTLYKIGGGKKPPNCCLAADRCRLRILSCIVSPLCFRQLKRAWGLHYRCRKRL